MGACNSHQHSPHHYQAQGDHCRSNDNPVFSVSSSSSSPGGWWGRVRLQGSSSVSRSSNRTHSLPCFSGWFTHFLQALQRYTKHFMGSPDWHVTEFNIHIQKLPQETVLDMLESMEMAELIGWWAKNCILEDEVLRSLRHYMLEQRQGHNQPSTGL